MFGMSHSKYKVFNSTVVLLLLLFILCCNGQIDCKSPPMKSCAFYEECLESKYHCGPDGYPIGFGKKFCNIFEENMDEFSEKGQKFLWDTMHCLQASLVTPLIDNTSDIDCKTVQKIALDTHTPCYLQTGFCETTLSDKIELLKIFLGNDISDVFSTFVHQAIEVLENCTFDEQTTYWK